MPIGIITNVLSVLFGGLVGGLLSRRIPRKIKEALPLIFGFSSMMIGISLIVKLERLPAVMLSLILGTLVGELLDVEARVTKAVTVVQSKLMKNSKTDKAVMAEFLSILVVFCASGTGIFGALQEGMTGDHTILLAKSILDFFTAVIFATTVGYLICIIAVPQFLIFMALFLCAGLIIPLADAAMLGDFSACGGLIALAAGFRICKICDVRLVNVLPALILIMPISWLWGTFIG